MAISSFFPQIRHQSFKNGGFFCSKGEAGRSMIEMLSILAFTGILSIGILVGYPRAVYKYRLNKMVEQYNIIADYISLSKHNLNNSPQSYYTVYPIMKKLNAVPEEMIKGNNPEQLCDIFGNRSYLTKYPAALRWEINLSNNDPALFPSNKNIRHLCQAFYQHVIMPKHADIYAAGIVKNPQARHSIIRHKLFGDEYCTNRKCLRNLSSSQIHNICTLCPRYDGNCKIVIQWK